MNKKDRLRFLKTLPQVDIHYAPLQESLSFLQPVYKDIETFWNAMGNKEPIMPYLNDRIADIKQGTIHGFIGFNSAEEPIGVCWVDMPNKRYGNCMVHAGKPEYRTHLAVKLARSGLMDGTVTELIQFTGIDDYLNGFLGMGMAQKFRYRMGLLKEDFPVEDTPIPPQVKVEPLTVAHAETIGNISCIAHTHRQDLEGYIDYAYPDLCAHHKRKLLQGEFGKLIEPASLLINYYNKPVGSCIVIDIPCWGYEHMAWVFDIAILPEYHGLGLGKILLKETLKGTALANYPIIGLAVTVTNQIAYALYEKLGFQIYEEYYEILSETAMKRDEELDELPPPEHL